MRLIVEQLHGDTRALASLCLLDKESLGLMTPLLYKTAHLFGIRSISRFCGTIILSKRDLGIYPTSIRFQLGYGYSDKQLSHLIKSIQDTLCRTPNLTDLDLGVDIANQIDLRLHQHLSLHPPSFSLHRLACPFTPDLMPFISAQTSIHTLTFHFHISGNNSSIDTSLPSSVLPRLKSIKADAYTAIALLPGRPISHIDISDLSLRSLHSFNERLRKSSAPGGIESLSMSLPRGNFWKSSLDFITALTETCGASLRELKVKGMSDIHMKDVSGSGWRMGGY